MTLGSIHVSAIYNVTSSYHIMGLLLNETCPL